MSGPQDEPRRRTRSAERGRAGWFCPPVPDDLVYVEPHPRRIQAVCNGRTVIDTERALMVHRRGHALSCAFPAGEVGDLPSAPVGEAPGYVQVAWDAVDTWLEEAACWFITGPTRITASTAGRRTGVCALSPGDTTLVDTADTMIVFETALQPRLYIDPALVRTDLLRRTDTSSYCNYKGVATYWAAVVGDTVIDDVAFSYDDPLPETLPIKGFLSFDAARVDVVEELPLSAVDEEQSTIR
jgi:uncharacterized protein (DUF427 family)